MTGFRAGNQEAEPTPPSGKKEQKLRLSLQNRIGGETRRFGFCRRFKSSWAAFLPANQALQKLQLTTHPRGSQSYLSVTREMDGLICIPARAEEC